MKKLLYILLEMFLMVGCANLSDKEPTLEKSVIEQVVKTFASDELTPEEIKWWDDANANGGYLLIRGSERHLDTIVNHVHILFITDP